MPYEIIYKDNIVFGVRAIAKNIRITVKGREKININDYNENAPKSGLLGLNTFNGQTVFSQIVYESTFKAASSAITSDTPFVVTVGSKKPENISLNGTALKDGEYRIASGQLYINAGVAETGKNVLTFTADGETYTFEFTVTEASAAAPPKEERGGLAGWAIALIVIACVVAAGGGGFCLYWFVLRGKFKPDGKNTDGGAEKTAEDGENGGEH